MDTTQTPPGPSRVSVIDPISPAFERVGKILFRPFDIRKWFTLGFCAWLAWLGQGGSGGGNSNWNRSGDETARDMETAWDWIRDHIDLVISLAIVLFIVIIAFWILFTWLSSRGKFMFLDGVVHDRGAVVEPWRRFRMLGNSLFGFRIVLGLITTVALGLVVGFMVLNLLAMGIRDGDLGFAIFIALGLWIAAILALTITFVLIGMAVNDFVVPIMWRRSCRVMAAWSELLSLLSPNLGAFILYVLLKFLIGLVILVISCVAICVTCCIAALPYIGTVLLLPLFVFRRSYSMYFLSQLDPDYASFGPAGPASPAEPADTPLGPTGENR